MTTFGEKLLRSPVRLPLVELAPERTGAAVLEHFGLSAAEILDLVEAGFFQRELLIPDFGANRDLDRGSPDQRSILQQLRVRRIGSDHRWRGFRSIP